MFSASPPEELEANIAENKRSAEMLELQETLCWPSLSQLETTAYIPDVRQSVDSTHHVTCLHALRHWTLNSPASPAAMSWLPRTASCCTKGH